MIRAPQSIRRRRLARRTRPVHLRLVASLSVCLAAFVGVAPLVAQGAPELAGTIAQLVQSSDPVTNVSNQKIDFGEALDLDQDLLVVGAPGEDSAVDGTTDVGAVYVFERSAGDWERIQKIRAPTEAQGGEFGAAVAVARGADLEGPIDFLFVSEPIFGTPEVHVYRRTPGTDFVFETTLSGAANSRFGEALALDFFEPPTSPSDDSHFFAAIGSSNVQDPDDTGNNQHGSVAIFQRSGDPATWGLTHEFFGGPNHNLGTAVDLAGINVLAAGALDGLGVGDGGARWLTQGNFDGTVYNYAGECRLLPAAQAAHLGKKVVAVNDDTTSLPNAALGLPEDDSVAFNNGKVLIFDLSSDCAGSSPANTKTPILTLEAPDTSTSLQFGSALAFSGSSLAVGAPGLSADNSGVVYLYERGATNLIWNPVGSVTLPRISTTVARCQGGTALGMTADHLAAGCPAGGNPQNEAVYVHSLEIFSDGFESGDTLAWQ